MTEVESRERQETIKRLLEYWPLISSGPHSVDEKNKNEVQIVQKVLSATGHYNGEINGKYNPATDGARWRFVKDIMQDPDSFKRNLNMYVVSEDSVGNLVIANSSIKNNLKTWLNKSRMINDTVDILDARIVNIGIDFVAKGDVESNRFLILDRANIALREKYTQKLEIGEPFYITDIYKVLQGVEGISTQIPDTLAY